MYTHDRDAYRQVFFTAWEKHFKKMPLTIEEARLVEVILEHPDLQTIFSQPGNHLQQEYVEEENPFLHISLHLSLREQIRLDRPIGITDVFQSLLDRYQDKLHVEHLLLPCLRKMLFIAQHSGTMPSDEEYLVELKKVT